MLLHHYDRQGLLMAHSADESPDPFFFIMHAHDICEIYYFVEGRGYYTVEGANYPLEPGVLLLMREGEAHVLHIDPSHRYERITVNFAYETVDPTGAWEDLHSLFYQRPLGSENLTRLTGEAGGYMRTLFDRLCAASLVEGKSGDAEMRAVLAAILTEVVSARRRDPAVGQIDPNAEFSLKIQDVTKAEARIVLEVISYVNDRLFQIENLAEIEEHFFFSRSYINRIFKAATGSSLWNYVILKRLIAAQALIKNGTPASVAAARCGFHDYSSFYKQYRNKLGVAPAREKNQLLFK